MEGDQLQLQDIFEFQQTGIAPDGRVQGRFRSTGLRTKYFDRLIAAGVKPQQLIFEPGGI